MRTRKPDQHERGSSSVEFAILGVTLLLFIGALIAGGRIAMAHNAVQSAATAAARDASLARSESAAQTQGSNAAGLSLVNSGLSCINESTSVDTSAFAAPLGVTGSVRATITCSVDLSAAALPGFPGSITISKDSISPVDPYRQR
jgi:Flp pilus assembly protein TadG